MISSSSVICKRQNVHAFPFSVNPQNTWYHFHLSSSQKFTGIRDVKIHLPIQSARCTRERYMDFTWAQIVNPTPCLIPRCRSGCRRLLNYFAAAHRRAVEEVAFRLQGTFDCSQRRVSSAPQSNSGISLCQRLIWRKRRLLWPWTHQGIVDVRKYPVLDWSSRFGSAPTCESDCLAETESRSSLSDCF